MTCEKGRGGKGTSQEIKEAKKEAEVDSIVKELKKQGSERSRLNSVREGERGEGRGGGKEQARK